MTFSKNLEDDLKRRDFTINAIAYDPENVELVDPYGGVADLARHQGKKRDGHSLLMKELAKTRRENTIYCFVHETKGTFTGTRHQLKELDETVSIGELGLLIKGKYKSHKGWSVKLNHEVR